MNEKNKNKKGTGFYIALCCCAALIALIGYFTDREGEKVKPVNNTPEIILETEEEPSPTPEIVTPKPTLSPSVSEKKEKASVQNEEELPVFDEKNENLEILEKGEPEEFYEGEILESVFINKDPSFILPAEGEICEKFSGENLIYNEALDDWRTHNGIDIKTDEDAQVLVSSDGIIEEIYTDVLGNTVLIDHKNGFKTKYSNLDNTESLTIGVKMKQGDFLAKVGNYNMGENTKEPHLHFEIIKDDEFVNPEEYIG